MHVSRRNGLMQGKGFWIGFAVLAVIAWIGVSQIAGSVIEDVTAPDATE